MRCSLVRIGLGLAVVTSLLAVTRGASAKTPTCYALPFPNPNLMDGWGSTCCGRTSPHRGVDFPQAPGTPIPAIAEGIVHVVPKSSCLGNVVVIEHPDGMFSGYAHMIVPTKLMDGAKVKLGDIVGKVGATGTCQNGPHLHLSLSDHLTGYYEGTTVDPYKYIEEHLDTCNHAPKGKVESASCEAVVGFAQDVDAPLLSIDARLTFGGPEGDAAALVFPTVASLHRDDLCEPLGSCEHGFSVPVPFGFFDGVAHPVFAYGVDTEGGPSGLLGQATVTCTQADLPAVPVGRVKRRVPASALPGAWPNGALDVASLPTAVVDALPAGPLLAAAPALVVNADTGELFVREYQTRRPINDARVLDAWRWGSVVPETVAASALASTLLGAPWPVTPYFAADGADATVMLDEPPPLWAELEAFDAPASVAVGASFDVTLRLRNRGSLAWNGVALAPTPRDVASPWCAPSWTDCTRAASLPATETGGAASVTATLLAPSAPGTARVCFGLVVGAHWFSDPGANGPADDAICRDIDVTRASDGANASSGCSLGRGRPPRVEALLAITALAAAFASRRRQRAR